MRMPAEWALHQATLMEWPTITRKEFWGELFDRAKADWAAMAQRRGRVRAGGDGHRSRAGVRGAIDVR